MLNGFFSGKYRHAVASFVFLILTFVMTYPLIFNLDNHLIGRGTADVWQFPWNNFVFRESVLNGRDPYFTDYIYYPEGTSLLLHTNTEVNSVTGLLLSPFLNEIGQMNACILISIFLSALGTYLLTLRLTGSWVGSVFAGLAFAFSPFLITRLFGHINFSLTQTLPLALWAFLRMSETQSYRFAIWTGVSFALTYYCNQYYMMFLIISFFFMLLYGLWRIPTWRTARLLKNLCIAGLVAFLLLAQVGWHFLQDYREKVIAEHAEGGALARQGSAFIQDYIKPGPMLGYFWRKGAGPHEKVTTGLTVLSLAIAGFLVAVRRRNQLIVMIGLLGILFLLITLGPSFAIGSLQIPLPYAVMKKIPYMNHVRIPYRAAPMVALTFAVLAGAGISFLMQLNVAWKKVLVACLFPLLLLELAIVPLYLLKFDPPSIYYKIRNMDDGSILTLPFHNNIANAAHQMKYQIIHRKKLLNGRTARATPLYLQEEYLKKIPIARTFERYTRLPVDRQILNDVQRDQAAASAFRQFFNLRYLAFHDKFANRNDVLDYVKAVFPDARLLYEDPEARVYALPAASIQESWIIPDKNTLSLFLFSGWKGASLNRAICIENGARLLLPESGTNGNLKVEMKIRSKNQVVISQGKVLFKINNENVQEIKLKKRFQLVQFSVPREQLIKGRRMLKLEIIDSNGKWMEFARSRVPKFELSDLRFQ